MVADITYQKPEDFLLESFNGTPPTAQFLWLDQNAQTKIAPILGHNYEQARVRYWRAQDRTAWILEEIGKEFPITAGFVVQGNHLVAARVLIYRETRGEEIHYSGFLQQFKDATLSRNQLNTKIDGITGATLSVDAMKRMAMVALSLNQLAPAKSSAP